jgi:hypothetical protein
MTSDRESIENTPKPSPETPSAGTSEPETESQAFAYPLEDCYGVVVPGVRPSPEDLLKAQKVLERLKAEESDAVPRRRARTWLSY